jgi:adenylate cyclase
LTIQPDYQPALAGRAVMTGRLAVTFRPPNWKQQLLEAERDAQRAVDLDASDAVAYYALGRVRQGEGRIADAIEANSQALELNPNYVRALITQGGLLILNGQAALALAPEQMALELSPLDPARYIGPMYWICHAYMHLSRFRDAITWCEKSDSIVPYFFSLADLVAAYAAIGEPEKAAAAKAQLLKLKPEFSITWYKNLKLSDNPVWEKEIEENIYAWMRKAGVPE